jgi:transglutaminase-like putative cysteine protease
MGAALAAYILAYLPGAGTPLRWFGMSLALLPPALALSVPWERVPVRLVRPALLILRVVLVLTGALVVFSRQVPLVRADLGHLGGAALGGLLALLAVLLLLGWPAWRVEAGALPAIVGLLVAAGMDHSQKASFLPLACVSALALWAYAFLSGGPRRLGLPLVLSAIASGALVWGIVWFLPVAQPQVQDYVLRAYSQGQTGLSDRSELGEVESLAQSHRIVARVWSTAPQLLRMQVFTYFDGRSWLVGPRQTRPLNGADQSGAAESGIGPLLRDIPGRLFTLHPQPRPGAIVETKVLPVLSFEDGWGLLVPATTDFIVWPGEKLTIDELGRVVPEGRVTRLYGVASSLERSPSEATLADLAPPVHLDVRVRALAKELRSGTRSDRDIVARTIDYLRSGYRYTLDVGRFKGQDPLAEFLFDKKAGYCEYFATAAVVLLRLQGIPSRYVKGVAVRGASKVAGHYVVRESDSHAWIEAYVSDEGWIEEDPTPPGGDAMTHAAEPRGPFADGWEALQAFVREAWARFQQGTWPRIVAAVARASRRTADAVGTRPFYASVALAIAAVLAVGLWLRRGRSRATRPGTTLATSIAVPPDLKAAVGAIEKHWSRRGRPRPASSGLREHLDRLPTDALSPEERETSLLVVESYYRASFGGQLPSSEELAVLRHSLKTLSDR